jgi:hypothetical protein
MDDKTEMHDRAFALVQETPPASSQPEDAQQDSGSGYFLEVDDRHRYRTPDDVKRAIAESDRRLAELAPWEERLKYHGIDSPEGLDNVVDEYLTRLEERQRVEGAAALTDQDREALAYLQKLGFLTKGDVAAREQGQHAEEARQQEVQVIESARNDLRGLLKDAGLSEGSAKYAEPWMREFIELQSLDSRGRIKPGSLLDRFWDGGESAKKVVEEVFAAWKVGVDELRGVTRQPTRTPSPKKTLTTRGGRVFPEGNPSGAHTPSDLHNRAWELLQRTPARRRGIR